MRTKKIDGVTYTHHEDYKESPGVVIDHVLIDNRLRKIVGNMLMAASRRKRLNRKLERRRATERWVPALYKENEGEKVHRKDAKSAKGEYKREGVIQKNDNMS